MRVVNNKGVALIIVLTGLTILAAFSSEFTYRTRVDVRVATNLEKRVQAYFHARSGMEIARLVITSQKMVEQALSSFGMSGRSAGLELWRFAPKFVDVFTSSSLSFMGFELMNLKDVTGVGVREGGFEIQIEPEDSKVSVNAGSTDAEKRAAFIKLYQVIGINSQHEGVVGIDRENAQIAMNIIDWSDPDDARSDVDSNGNLLSTAGAGENMSYSKWGYRARNARMDSLDELLLVEGVSDDLFCQTSNMLTVYNTDKINVNEADPYLIRNLVCQSLVTNSEGVCGPTVDASGLSTVTPGPIMNQAMYLFETCRMMKQQLNMPAFSSAADFVSFWSRLPEPLNQLVQVNADKLKAQVGTKSTVLRVTSRGWVGASGHEMSAVIDTGTTAWLSWKERGFDSSSKLDLGRGTGEPAAVDSESMQEEQE